MAVAATEIQTAITLQSKDDDLAWRMILAGRPYGRDLPVLPRKISYEEFLELVDEDSHAEWVDGNIEVSSPSSNEHQIVLGFLYRLIYEYVEAKDLGVVRFESFGMKLKGKHPGREPDLLFLANEHLDRLRNSFVDGAADVVIEIVSPESAERDYVTKLKNYEAGGVHEYWIIDPERTEAIFYRLRSSGTYAPVSPDSDGFYISTALPGFKLWVDTLWQRPLPSLFAALRETGISLI